MTMSDLDDFESKQRFDVSEDLTTEFLCMSKWIKRLLIITFSILGLYLLFIAFVLILYLSILPPSFSGVSFGALLLFLPLLIISGWILMLLWKSQNNISKSLKTNDEEMLFSGISYLSKSWKYTFYINLITTAFMIVGTMVSLVILILL